jgi:hypothetical protein
MKNSSPGHHGGFILPVYKRYRETKEREPTMLSFIEVYAFVGIFGMLYGMLQLTDR